MVNKNIMRIEQQEFWLQVKTANQEVCFNLDALEPATEQEWLAEQN